MDGDWAHYRAPMWWKVLCWRLDLWRGLPGLAVHPRTSKRNVEAAGGAEVRWGDGTTTTYPRDGDERLYYDRFSGYHVPDSQVGQWMTDELLKEGPEL